MNINLNFGQTGIVIRYELLKHLRSKRMLILLAITALMGLIIVSLPPMLGDAYPAEAEGFMKLFVGFSQMLVILSAVFFGSDAVISEYKNKTGYALFPQPVSKLSILMGKFIAAMVIGVLAVVLYYVLALMFMMSLYSSFSVVHLMYSLFFALWFLAGCMAVAFMFSSVLRGVTESAIVTFFFFSMISGVVMMAMMTANTEPYFVLSYIGDVTSYIVEDPYPTESQFGFEFQGGDAFGDVSLQAEIPDVGVSAAVIGGYLVGCMAISAYMFNRKEMN
jgi:ABC-2 type transport system permease protein